MHSLMPVGFFMFLSINDFLPGCLFAVVIKCFTIGVNVWWVYLTPQNIPRAISVLTLGNKVISYCILYCVAIPPACIKLVAHDSLLPINTRLQTAVGNWKVIKCYHFSSYRWLLDAMHVFTTFGQDQKKCTTRQTSTAAGRRHSLNTNPKCTNVLNSMLSAAAALARALTTLLTVANVSCTSTLLSSALISHVPSLISTL